MAKKSQYKQKLEYNNNYNRNNYRSFSVRFNNKVEKTVIAWLEAKESVKGYLCDLIIADMEKNGKRTVSKKPTKKAVAKPVTTKKTTKKAPVTKKAAKPAKKTTKKK